MKHFRFAWALCSVLATGATIGACARSKSLGPNNLQVTNLPPAGNAGWRIEARTATGKSFPIDRPVPRSAWRAFAGTVPDRPSQVIVTMVDPGLGRVDCRQIRVRARMSGGSQSWSDVSVTEGVWPQRGTCLLTLSWPGE